MSPAPVPGPDGVALLVRFEWIPAGPVTLDVAGHLALPAVPDAPGVYRWTLTDRPGQRAPLVYIGEGGNLRRRLRNYRRPTRMRTAGKLHRVYADHLAAGGRVHLDVATSAGIEAGARKLPLPLGRRTSRHLAEHAAIALAYLDDAAELLNLDTE